MIKQYLPGISENPAKHHTDFSVANLNMLSFISRGMVYVAAYKILENKKGPDFVASLARQAAKNFQAAHGTL